MAEYDAAAPRRRGAHRGDRGAGAAAAIPVGAGGGCASATDGSGRVPVGGDR